MKKQIIVFILSMSCLVGVMANMARKEAQHMANNVCAACHGKDGHSLVDSYPSLAGQKRHYLIQVMKSYQLGNKGPRNNAIMLQQMQSLSSSDIIALAAYFSSQPLSKGDILLSELELGQKIYRGGIANKGIPACSACHGPTAKGLGLAGFPALSGQHMVYTVIALKAYRSGERKSLVNAIMNGVAKNMDDKEIKAVSSYVAGVY